VRIAINGAGIAGPALAFWLRKSGHDILLVEQAPRLRSGGYVIDFWGVGWDVAERMGLIPRIRDVGYQVREVRFVDRDGARTGGFSTDVFGRMTDGRFTSLRRSDLSAIVYEALDDGVETIFGDSIARIDDDCGRVQLTFDRAAPREVDLVVGADGLHSRVRALAFPPEGGCEVSLGYHVAAVDVEGYRPRDELVYVSHGVPGRQISRFSMREDRTLFLFVFRDEYLAGRRPKTDPERCALLREVFADAGWETPDILAAMSDAREVYFDRVSQIRMRRWTKGRTALIGDAAACVSLLAGEGTGLALAEAYVLAGEIDACGDDLAGAFTRYERRLMSFLGGKQRAAARFASSFAPKTSLGLAVRDAVTRCFRVPVIADLLVGRVLRDDIELPAYRGMMSSRRDTAAPRAHFTR
jgi:2-polyprenyl-6-methoxyphenol hydroxylase-like FAD-dependent oxidoreductase